jgi:glutaredoxin
VSLKVRLFIKPWCSWCHEAMHWLEERGISYEKLDVSANQKANDEMFRLSGQTLAPVIEVDGKILADFGPDELAGFWAKISPAQKQNAP